MEHTTAAQVQRLTDVEDIRAVALRYCRGIDRLDVALVRSAYFPDATDHHGTFQGLAWEFAEYAVSRLAVAYQATMHLVANHTVEVDGDVATGELYNVSYHLRSTPDGDILDTWWGRYVDRYERREGEWRIAHRTCVHEWTRSDPVTATMPIPAELFVQGRADRGTGAAGR